MPSNTHPRDSLTCSFLRWLHLIPCTMNVYVYENLKASWKFDWSSDFFSRIDYKIFDCSANKNDYKTVQKLWRFTWTVLSLVKFDLDDWDMNIILFLSGNAEKCCRGYAFPGSRDMQIILCTINCPTWKTSFANAITYLFFFLWWRCGKPAPFYGKFMTFMQSYVTLYDSVCISCFSFGSQCGLNLWMW